MTELFVIFMLLIVLATTGKFYVVEKMHEEKYKESV